MRFLTAVCFFAAAAATTALAASNLTSIADVIASTSTLSLLAQFLNNTALNDTVQLLSIGPNVTNASNITQFYTVFAPNNFALASIANNLATFNTTYDLDSVLKYHILNGSYMASNFSTGSNFVPTILTNRTYDKMPNNMGLVLDVSKNSTGSLELFYGWNSANVVQADIKAANGIVHIIDHVLLYPLNDSQTANSSNAMPKLSQFLNALNTTNLTSFVNGDSGITVFAPSDEAFSNVNLTQYNTSQLQSIIQFHILPAVYYSTNLSAFQTDTNVTTVQGSNMTVSPSSGTKITLEGYNGTDAKITYADVLTNNGVLHVIDHVLLPSNTTPNTSATAAPKPTSGAGQAKMSAMILLVIVGVATVLV